MAELSVSPSAIWYYLKDSRQVGPFTLVELRLMAERDVISPATLVWSRGRGNWSSLSDIPSEPTPRSGRRFPWITAAVGIAAVTAASFILATRSPDGTVTAGGHKSQERLVAADDPPTPGSGPAPAPAIVSEKGSVHLLNEPHSPPAVVATAPIPPAIILAPIPTHLRKPLSEDAQRELEFWRGIAYSQNMRLYESYLRRYPAGTYVEPAAAKIKALKKAVASKPVKVQVRKKVAAKNPPQTEALTVPEKPRSRCWNGGVERCR
ncbi:MAG TPA: DUF4339 domain-containing protein [Aestuariivirgaceae bacterium]|nr:DUF4339 domain-containing protein [Aestuariivirgaceae bacterium]